ncbi:hypothetical protein [Prevotella dentalis]|uniref:hypothetical protein n=1 Tax=Prevotella dentalis TaxID=52227 RepID=UPI0014391EB9|nr:hypothetical protein [Prevotella dentalis]
MAFAQGQNVEPAKKWLSAGAESHFYERDRVLLMIHPAFRTATFNNLRPSV